MNPRYRADIDGLRSIAILSVVLFHAGFSGLNGGYVGVDVFFVISGYLIGSHVYRDVLAGRFSFLSFYARRAKRILPAFFAVVLFTLAVGAAVLSPGELRRLGQQGFAAIVSASNVFFWRTTSYFQPASETQPLLMTWSLGVEEQFYVFFPWLIVGLRRCRREWHVPILGALTLVSFVLAIVWMHRDVSAAFYLLPFRAWELGVGCLLGLSEITAGETKWRRLGERFGSVFSVAGLLLIVAPMVLYWPHISFPGWTAVPPVLGTALLIAGSQSFVNQRLLSARPLVWIGRVSYSWYLWHWPLMSFLRVCAPRGWTPSVGLATALASLGIGAASYYAIETPFRKSKAAEGGLLLRYGAWSIALSALFLVPVVTRGLPSRYPRATVVEAEAERGQPDLCLVSYGVSSPSTRSECIPPVDGRPTLALLGDSHSSALSPYLREATEAHGWHFAEFAKSSCPPLKGVTRAMHQHPAQAAECMRYNEVSLRWVLDHPEVRTVALAGFWVGPFSDSPVVDAYVADAAQVAHQSEEKSLEEFKSGLRGEIEAIQKSGRNVLVLQDVPHLEFDPVLVELTEAIPLRHRVAALLTPQGAMQSSTVPRAEAISRIQDSMADVVRSIAKQEGAGLLETQDAFCGEHLCQYAQSGYSLYFDSQHLSARGSKVALRQAPEQLWSEVPASR